MPNKGNPNNNNYANYGGMKVRNIKAKPSFGKLELQFPVAANDTIKIQYDRICGPEGYTLITAPQGGMLAEKTLEGKVTRYLTKFEDAGVEFAKTGKVSKDTITKLEAPMLGHNTFSMLINKNWDDPNVGPYGK